MAYPSLELFIALRYINARRKGFFSVMTSLISVGGIMLGVAALIITLSVMSGFHKDITAKILGVQPHITVSMLDSSPLEDYKDVQAIIDFSDKDIKASAAYIYGQSVIRKSRTSVGAIIKGINVEDEDKLVNVRSHFVDISDDEIKEFENSKQIILGAELAKIIGAYKGDNIVLMVPGEHMTPRMANFKVAGLFNSGMYEFDTTLAYISLSSAQDMFGYDEDSVTGIGVSVKNYNKALKISPELQNKLSYPYKARSWQEMNKNLFSALKLEKIMMFIILGLIILVASFNIVSNLILLSVEKFKEIGILAAMGLSSKRIALIFFYEGIIVGFIGTFLGIILGISVGLLLKKYQFISLPSDVYYLDRLPVSLAFSDILSVSLCAVLITVIAAIYPAYQVSKMQPLDAIRQG